MKVSQRFTCNLLTWRWNNCLNKVVFELKMFGLATRRYCSQAGEYVLNRNPRNLEKICIAYKPKGWHLEKAGRSFWHKLVLERTGKHITSKLVHYKNGTVLSASTKEWSIRKFLYSTTDKSSYINLGRVMSQRCLQSGITEMTKNDFEITSPNLILFYDQMEKNGITLKEPETYINPRPSDIQRPEKPWEALSS